MKTLLVVVCLVCAASLSEAALVLADWTFTEFTATGTDNTYGIANSGALTIGSSASGHHASSTSWSAPAGNGSSDSYSANTWAVGDYFQFVVSTVGYTGISIQWDQAGSSTGPRDFELQYSLTGSSFSTVAGSAYTVALSGWSTTVHDTGFDHAPDLSSIAGAIENQGTVYFRLVNTT